MQTRNATPHSTSEVQHTPSQESVEHAPSSLQKHSAFHRALNTCTRQYTRSPYGVIRDQQKNHMQYQWDASVCSQCCRHKLDEDSSITKRRDPASSLPPHCAVCNCTFPSHPTTDLNEWSDDRGPQVGPDRPSVTVPCCPTQHPRNVAPKMKHSQLFPPCLTSLAHSSCPAQLPRFLSWAPTGGRGGLPTNAARVFSPDLPCAPLLHRS